MDLIAGKDSAYKNKKFGFILDSGRGASTFIAGTVLSLFAPATRMEKGKKEPCKVGKNDEYSCKEFTYFIAAKSTGLINKDTRPQLYEMVDTYETELDLIFQDQISQIIADTQRQKHFKYFKTEIINEIKGAIIDFGSMNALLTAATKAPDDPVSMFHAAFGVIVTQLKGASKELAQRSLLL